MIGFGRFLHTSGGVLYLRTAGIERPADLRGKRVQYPGAPGPGGKAIVATMVAGEARAVRSLAATAPQSRVVRCHQLSVAASVVEWAGHWRDGESRRDRHSRRHRSERERLP
jgi:hypothetical protein